MTKRTAEDAFIEYHTAIYNKMGRLAMRVESARTEFNKEGHTNWALVGDLAMIEEMLGRALGEEK